MRLFFMSRQEYAGHVVTDLVEIRRLGESKKAENLDFRRYITAHHHRVDQLQVLAEEIQQQIDCTACANCCRYSVVTVNRSEIENIALYLQMEPEEVNRQYMAPDPDARTTRVVRSTKDGCIFLDGNLCTIYEARPKACRDFPYVAHGNRSLGGRVSSLCKWASLCPIIYNALEGYKRLIGYHSPIQTPEDVANGCAR